VLDPHSAVGWTAADRFAASPGGSSRPIITLATAHPAKFDAAIRQALGFAPPLPDAYADWRARPLAAIDLDQADYPQFRRLLVSDC
jgi:threonine synthase